MQVEKVSGQRSFGRVRIRRFLDPLSLRLTTLEPEPGRGGALKAGDIVAESLGQAQKVKSRIGITTQEGVGVSDDGRLKSGEAGDQLEIMSVRAQGHVCIYNLQATSSKGESCETPRCLYVHDEVKGSSQTKREQTTTSQLSPMRCPIREGQSQRKRGLSFALITRSESVGRSRREN